MNAPGRSTSDPAAAAASTSESRGVKRAIEHGYTNSIEAAHAEQLRAEEAHRRMLKNEVELDREWEERCDYHPDAVETEVYSLLLMVKPTTDTHQERPQRLLNLDQQSCTCTTGCPRKGRGHKPYCCSEWGASCGPNCAYNGSCNSLWSASVKERLFGKSTNGKDVLPNAYFKHWYEKNRSRGRVIVAGLAQRVYEEVDDTTDWDDDLAEFKKRYDAALKLPSSDPTRRALPERLVSFAFTNDRDLLATGTSKGYDFWYSNCRSTWYDEDNGSHCWVCKECMDWREWHCKVCNKCQHGVTITCEGCTGVCRGYHNMMKMEQYMIEEHEKREREGKLVQDMGIGSRLLSMTLDVQVLANSLTSYERTLMQRSICCTCSLDFYCIPLL